ADDRRPVRLPPPPVRPPAGRLSPGGGPALGPARRALAADGPGAGDRGRDAPRRPLRVRDEARPAVRLPGGLWVGRRGRLGPGPHRAGPAVLGDPLDRPGRPGPGGGLAPSVRFWPGGAGMTWETDSPRPD